MYKIFADAIIDTAKMIPLLLVIYIMIESVEVKFSRSIRSKIQKAGKAGPVIGAVLGSVPQCGFSVISTALYTKRLISLGTLLSVYLATSDEAIPIILAEPHKASVLLPLISAKVIIGLVAGFGVDLFLGLRAKSGAAREICAGDTNWIDGVDYSKTEGCCGHECASEKPKLKEMVWHPIIHTIKVFAFIFIITVIINLVIYQVGQEQLQTAMNAHKMLQPIIAGLVGLIPNCAASVAITQLFLKGGLSFGATIAGLSSSAGLGILVLFKENKNVLDSVKVVGLLYLISVLAGMAVVYVFPAGF